MDFWTGFAFLTDSFDLNFYLEKVCSPSAFEGGNCVAVKSGLKQEIVGTAFFKLLSSFFTRVEGGIGGPDPPNGALGSPVKTSRNLFRRNQTSILVYVFYDYFYVICTGRRIFNSFRSGVKKFNNSIETRYDNFPPPVGEAALTLCGL